MRHTSRSKRGNNRSHRVSHRRTFPAIAFRRANHAGSYIRKHPVQSSIGAITLGLGLISGVYYLLRK